MPARAFGISTGSAAAASGVSGDRQNTGLLGPLGGGFWGLVWVWVPGGPFLHKISGMESGCDAWLVHSFGLVGVGWGWFGVGFGVGLGLVWGWFGVGLGNTQLECFGRFFRAQLGGEVGMDAAEKFFPADAGDKVLPTWSWEYIF